MRRGTGILLTERDTAFQDRTVTKILKATHQAHELLHISSACKFALRVLQTGPSRSLPETRSRTTSEAHRGHEPKVCAACKHSRDNSRGTRVTFGLNGTARCCRDRSG